MNWNPLTSIEELDRLISLSESIPVLILKHSTRCSTSRFALKRLEQHWLDSDNDKVVPFYLDLLEYRNVSNEIENRFGIRHESPQVLVIKNGKCVYFETHSAIEYPSIMQAVE